MVKSSTGSKLMQLDGCKRSSSNATNGSIIRNTPNSSHMGTLRHRSTGTRTPRMRRNPHSSTSHLSLNLNLILNHSRTTCTLACQTTQLNMSLISIHRNLSITNMPP